MKIIEYRYTIPLDKRDEFLEYAKSTLKPTWQKHGCKKYELSVVSSSVYVGRQIVEEGAFIERLYFEDDFDLKNFYNDALTYDKEKTRAYEDRFLASSIELRVLNVMVE